VKTQLLFSLALFKKVSLWLLGPDQGTETAAPVFPDTFKACSFVSGKSNCMVGEHMALISKVYLSKNKAALFMRSPLLCKIIECTPPNISRKLAG
jgi:hypothetical protein